MSLRLGLVGAGRWGRALINTIPHVQGATLAAVASGNPETAGLVPKGCLVERDWKALIASPEIDALVLAVPAPVQKEIALAAFAARKPVLLEKPLALDAASARELLDAARKAKVFALVDHVLLFHPAYAELSRRLAGKPIDRLTAAVRNMGPFRKEEPALWDYGSHTLAMALDLFGRAPDEASAVLEKSEPRAPGRGENWRVELSFGKATATLFAGNLWERKEIRAEVKAGAKTLVFDDMGPHKLSENGHHVAVDAEKPLTRAVEAFVAGVSSGSTDLDGVELGVRVVETLERLSGRPAANRPSGA